MFLSRNKKNNVYPVNPSYTIYKSILMGSKLYRHVFVMKYRSLTEFKRGCKVFLSLDNDRAARAPGCGSRRLNSTHYCTALHGTELFIITFPYVNSVEKDIKLSKHST